MAGPILVSVFEPFGGASVNASQEVGRALAATDDRIELLTLPVTRGAAEALLLARLSREPVPAFAIALGEAGPEPMIRLEKVAINYDDFRIPDNGGNQPRDEPICADGPPAYFATLPVGEIARQLEGATPLPIRISLSAGAFLCNHIAYLALHLLATTPVCPFLFVHVPNWRPGGKTLPSFTLDDLAASVRAVLGAAADTVAGV